MSTLTVPTRAVNANRRGFLASLVGPVALSVVPGQSPVPERREAEPAYRVVALAWGPRYPDCTPRSPSESLDDRLERFSKSYGEHFQALKNWPRPKHCLDIPEGANVHPHFEEWAEDPVDRESGLVEVARRNRESLKTKQSLAGEPWFVLVEVGEAEFECECTHVDLGPDGVGSERWSSAYRFYLVHPTADELAKLA